MARKAQDKGTHPPVAPVQPPRNRRIVDQPVVLSDGSVEAPVEPQNESSSVAVASVVPANTSSPVLRSQPVPSTVEARVRMDAAVTSVVPQTFPEAPQSGSPPTVGVEDPWGALVADGLKSVETAARSATAGPSSTASEVPARGEPEGSIGAPETRRCPLIGPISPEWRAFPRSIGSFSFEDLVALGRRDARLVQAYTDSDAAWADSARRRFLQNYWLAYQVPTTLPCDRSMVLDVLDGIYVEGTVDFLTENRRLSASVDSRFWTFDLPAPSQAREHTAYEYLRIQWAVSYGFGRVITFADHDALRVNESPAARCDVVTEENAKQTKFRMPLHQFPALPSWIMELGLPGGLCIRLPRSLMYFRSEVEQPDRFSEHVHRLAYVVRLEMARAVANALELDYSHSRIVWIVSDAVLELLREFSSTPKVKIPARGELPARLQGIGDIEADCRAARTLGDEYLFERFHVPSGGWVRWAFQSAEGFVKANDFIGPVRGGRPVGGQSPRGSGRQGDPPSSYVGGFTPAPQASLEPSRTVERRIGLSSLIADNEIRTASGLGSLLRGFAVRGGGWSVRKLDLEALAKVEDAERRARFAEDRVREFQDRLDAANRNVDAWREHSERVACPYAAAPDLQEYRARGVAGEARMPDPYANPEAKRTRYAGEERDADSYRRDYPPRVPAPSGAGPSTPPASRWVAPSSSYRDPYGNDPYPSSSLHYR